MILASAPSRCLAVLFAATSLWLLTGCRPEAAPPPPPAADTPPLRVLVIGDPSLAKVVKREWDARAEGELSIREMTPQEFAEWKQLRLGADAVIFPTELFGDLAGRDWLEAIPDEAMDDPVYQVRDIFAAVRKQETVWGEDQYAVTFGSSPLLLFYRRDIFEKLDLQPPTTWAEYQTVAEQLHSRERVAEFLPSESQKWFGTVEPLKDQWAGLTLLARSAPYAKHRSQFSALFDYRSMDPLIVGPPFVRALDELRAARKLFRDAPAMSAMEAAAAVVKGEAAMAIGSLPRDEASKDQADAVPIAVAPLPGAKDVFNFRSEAWEQRSADESTRVSLVGFQGRLGAVTKECRQPSESVRLLTWLSGTEIGVQISTASAATGPYRQSQLPQLDKWTNSHLATDPQAGYGKAVQQALEDPNCLTSPRIPGSQQYLQSLAESVRSGISDEGPTSAELLQSVAAKWKEITTAEGIDKQRAAYRQSLGLGP